MKKFLFFTFVFFILVGLVFVVFRNLKITTITCKSQWGVCSVAVKSQVDGITKGNFFETRNELNKALIANKNITSYKINFLLPFNFEINVIEKRAIVAFVKNDGQFALVDDEGLILDSVSETNLPRVVSYVPLATSQVMYIANLMNRIHNFFGSAGARVTLDGVEVSDIKGKDVFFPLFGDQDVLLGSLTLILSRLPSVKEASTIRVIDLRFRNPVLK